MYGYWNAGGLDNVVAMLLALLNEYVSPLPQYSLPPVVETPATGACVRAWLCVRVPLCVCSVCRAYVLSAAAWLRVCRCARAAAALGRRTGRT